ncbi:MAG TPA: alpha/beta fold hydrolase [Solirubrobacterales bacterium]
MNAETARAIASHEAAGRRFEAAGVGSFALDEGEGEAAVLVHGVPSSSYLYRKVAPLLAARGLRAVAFDFPGLGLAKRPERFDYSWSGLAGWMGAALEALAVERCHLVVHDIGGPIGFEWAIRNPERVLSLTALNTMAEVAGFRRPWSMHPFSVRGLGELWLRSLNRWAFSELFYLQGVGQRSAVPRDEVFAYYDLLKREDGGRAFLRIMRGFELTRAKEDFFRAGLGARSWPAQVVWGAEDPALGREHMRGVAAMLSVAPAELPAKHFLQEDQAPAIADAVAALAGGGA